MKVDEINKTKNIGISFLNIYLSIIFIFISICCIFINLLFSLEKIFPSFFSPELKHSSQQSQHFPLLTVLKILLTIKNGTNINFVHKFCP